MSSRIQKCTSAQNTRDSFILLLVFMTIIPNVCCDIRKHLVNIQKDTALHDVQAYRKQWKDQTCQKFTKLLKQTTIAVNKLGQAIKENQDDKKLSGIEKEFHDEILTLFKQELVDGEDLIWHSLTWLQESLKSGYKNLVDIKQRSKARLEALRDATLKEEEEYTSILDAEKLKKDVRKAKHHNKAQSLLKQLLEDVAQAANLLEEKLDDHVFENAINNPKFGHGANIEAVVKLETEGGHSGPGQDSVAVKVVDARGNQFVLSKSEDMTVPHTDQHFVLDVIYLVLLAFPFAVLCHLTSLPTMFGYIISGVILGPSGFSVLKSLVQIESLGEFGVFLILLTVGMEFSPAHLQQVFKPAVLGCVMQQVTMVMCGVVIGSLLQVSVKESAFVAACLSLSSTPLVVDFLSNREHEGSSDYSTILLGILVVQDVVLGFLVVLLPLIAGRGSGNISITQALQLTVTLFLCLCVAVLVTFLISRLLARMHQHLVKLPREILLLLSVAVAFVMLLITHSLGISMELGCFLAGVALSAQTHSVCEEVIKLIQPVKHVFSCIFFASIGLHVFPSFLVYELSVLTLLTLGVVSFKMAIGVIVLSFVLSADNHHTRWIVAAGLAQVSEFSFVLGSRARTLGLVSREVYLLTLSVTTLSQLFAPVVWRLSLWRPPIRTHTVPRKQLVA